MAEIDGVPVGSLPSQTIQDALNTLSVMLTAQVGSSNGKISLQDLLTYANRMSKDVLTFNLAAGATPTEGQLSWNAEDKTLNLGLAGGSILQLGEEELLYAVNLTGTPITNGQPVVISGSQGNRVVVSLAQATAVDSPYKIVAIATQAVANNGTGYFTRSGIVRDINTSAWAEGSVLYVSGVAGALTSIAPTKPAAQIPVGVVTRQHATVGTILVAPIVLPRLTHLPDVKITNPSTGQGLVFDAVLGLWVNGEVGGGGSGSAYTVYNPTATNIPRGAAVYVSGGYDVGGVVYPAVGLALAASKATASFTAVANTDIPAGEAGTILCTGALHGVDTSHFAANSILYLSPTVLGGLTMIEPSYPAYSCRMAIVTKVGVSGSLLVCPDTDPNFAAGTTLLSGLQTYPIVLSSAGVGLGGGESNAGYYSTRIIPSANIEVNNLSVFCTQSNQCLGMRLGIFSPGSASDTLLAQSPFWSGLLPLGLTTLPLTLDANGVGLANTMKLQANTSYMVAVQISANGAALAGYTGVGVNPPNHFARVDAWNPAVPTAGMVKHAGFSQSGTLIWFGLS